MIDVVAIDIDDTLCLTEAASFNLENEVLSRIGRPPMPREAHLSTWGQPLFHAISERSPGVDPDKFQAVFREVITEYIADGRLDDIPEENYRALDDLAAAGKRIALLTSRTEDEVRHMLAPDHKLAPRVIAIYHKGNTSFHKPDPRVFDRLLNDQSVDPGNVVYVGDSPTDAEAANRRGVLFVASLESGIRQRQDFADYNVAAFIVRFPDIVAAIRTLDITT